MSKTTVSLKYLKEAPSGKAILVTQGLKDSEGEEITHWLPISQIDYDEDEVEVGRVFDCEVPDWLLRKTGIVHE